MIDALCVGAHPDDVEIAMGGMIAGMVADGMRVAICDLSDGEPTPAGTHAIRLREAQEAAHALGISDRRTLTLPNRALQDTIEARRALAEVIRDLHPRLLFVHYPIDAHPDHIAANAIAEAARFYGKLVKTDMSGAPHWPARVFQFAAVHLRLHVPPKIIVDVTPHIERKMQALACYRSQFADNPANSTMLEAIRQQNAYWGSLIRVGFGEPLFCREEIGVRSISHLI